MDSKLKFSFAVRRVVASLILTILTPPPPVAAIEARKPPPVKQWRVKYEEGTEGITHGTKMKVTLNKQEIVCETKGRGLAGTFAIPFTDIIEVTHDSEFRSLARQVFGGDEVWSATDGWGVYDWGAGLCDPVGLAAYGVLSLVDQEKHFVTITWREQDDENVAVFRVGSADYASFLSALETSTGRRRKDLWAEREKFLQRQWDHTYFPERGWNDNFAPGQVRSKVGAQDRCHVLAPDSDEYLKNCSAGKK